MSGTPRTSAEWHAKLDEIIKHDPEVDSDYATGLMYCLDAEEKSHAVDLEALAESDRLRVKEGATLFNAQQALLTEGLARQKSEGELADLHATFERTVAAWKREELSWDEERKALTQERDDLLAYYIEIESVGDETKHLRVRRARERIESRRSK